MTGLNAATSVESGPPVCWTASAYAAKTLSAKARLVVLELTLMF